MKQSEMAAPAKTTAISSLLMVPSRYRGHPGLLLGPSLLAAAWAALHLGGPSRPELTDLAYGPILLWALWFGTLGGLTMAAAAVVAMVQFGPPAVYADGSRYWTAALYLGFGAIGGVLSTRLWTRQIAQQEAATSLGQVHRQLAAIVADSGDAIFSITPGGIVTSWNRGAEKLFGFNVSDIVGHSASVLVPLARIDEQERMWVRLAAGGRGEQWETTRRRKDGSLFEVLITASGVRGEAGDVVGVSVTAHDITNRKRLEATVAHQVSHDALTGLPNRLLLTDRLEQCLVRSNRHGTRMAVMFLDIDNLKLINDSVGHTQGDAVIRLVAREIGRSIRPEDSVARFGGAAFVVVSEDLESNQAMEIAERVIDAISQASRAGQQEIHITASLGITTSDGHSTAETLLQEADLAMYRAKQHGPGSVAVFDDSLRELADARLVTTDALHRALERNEFTVYYQPVIDLTSGTMVSAEALVRWQHPSGVFVGPDEFIPLAEDTGLIIPLGAWVLEQACTEVVAWRRKQPDMSVAVNVSVRQLTSDDLVETIEASLTRTGAPGSALSLEVTESAFLEDIAALEDRLADLKELSVILSVDDFGTGFSSLRRLKALPVDEMKIDRSFVEGLGIDPQDTALVAAIVALAAALRLSVTAEGVETLGQLKALRSLGCEKVQGFLHARPMPAASMRDLVSEARQWHVD